MLNEDLGVWMSSLVKVGLAVILLIGILLAIGWYALFHGYFDHGLFEIKQVEWSPSFPRRVAVVAERSDHEAMSSDQYFVLIADHVPSATELRFTYYSKDVIFRAAGDCLGVRWTDPHSLTITCAMRYPDPLYMAGIAVQKYRAGDVAIRYVNIADSGR
jgi:hypothetical protein